MNNVTINGFKRISKQAAKKLYEAGKPFYMCPVKLRPGEPWHPECVIVNLNPGEHYPFQSMVNNFKYYNCTNETGRYPAYYVKEGEHDAHS